MATEQKSPHRRDGVACVIINDEGKILVGIRGAACSHGNGDLQLPGGKRKKAKKADGSPQEDIGAEEVLPEHEKEPIAQTALDEAKEETDLDIYVVDTKEALPVTQDDFPGGASASPSRWNTHFVLCRLRDPSQVPVRTEPTKCDGWLWMSIPELRELCKHYSDESWNGTKVFQPIYHFFGAADQKRAELEKEFPGEGEESEKRRAEAIKERYGGWDWIS